MSDCFFCECEFFIEIRIKKIDIRWISTFLSKFYYLYELFKICFCCRCWSQNCCCCCDNTHDHNHIKHFLQILFDDLIHSWNFLVCYLFSEFSFSCLEWLFLKVWRIVRRRCDSFLRFLNLSWIFLKLWLFFFIWKWDALKRNRSSMKFFLRSLRWEKWWRCDNQGD